MFLKKITKKSFFIFTKTFQSIVSILSVFLFSNLSLFFSKKKKSINNECFVFGNGPSLFEMISCNIDFLKNADIAVVNFFFKNECFYILKPKYYIIADSGLINPTVELVNQFLVAFNKVSWRMCFFVPNDANKKFVCDISKNKYIKVIKYNRTPVFGWEKISVLFYKLNWGMPTPVNVLNAAVFLMLNLGYKKINLCGADFSMISDLYVNEENRVCCIQNHSYDQPQSYVMDRGALIVGLHSIADALNSFQLLNEYAQSLKASIVNRTKGSFIDVFVYEKF